MALGASNQAATPPQYNYWTRTADEQAAGYQVVNSPRIASADQANGLTSPQTVTPEARVRILQAREDLDDQFNSATGATDSYLPTQIEGAHVRVVDNATQEPELWSHQGQIQGNPAVLGAYTGAQETYDWSARQLGRSPSFAGGGKLTMEVHADMDQARALWGTGHVVLPEDGAATDPDIVHHESGHAVLDGARPNLGRNEGGAAIHEGYADGTALFTALDHPDVRADVLDKLQQGQKSNLASNIGEGYERLGVQQDNDTRPAGTPAQRLPPKTEGLRDLAGTPPADRSEPHLDSQKMSSATYNSVIDVYQNLKEQQPDASQDDLLKQASNEVGHDFARATDFLPQGSGVNQSDFGAAMIRADKNDQGGQYADIYAKNFKAAGVTPKDTSAEDARVAGLAQNPNLQLPSSLAQGRDFRVDENHAAPASTQRAANDYLHQNAGELGFTGKHYQAQEMYHNDRGETYVYYSNGADRDDPNASRMAEVAFDKDGKLMLARENRNNPPDP